MPEKALDAKTDDASSASSAEAEPQDVEQADSSTATDEGAEGTTDSSPDKEAKSLADVVAQVTKEAETTEAEAEVDSNKPETTEEGDQEEEQAAESDAPKEEQLPFHDHPRWKEVLGQRDEYKAKAERAEPCVKYVAELERFRQANRITPERFNEAMTLAALVENDPVAAVGKLRDILVGLETYTGERLTPDLQAKLDAAREKHHDGLIDDDTFKAVESTIRDAHKLRVEAKSAELKGQRTTQDIARQQQYAVTEALNAWTSSKSETDTDFKPSANGEIGKFELVRALFAEMWRQAPPETPQAAVSLAEKAYKAIADRESKQAKPLSKVLTSQRSSKTKAQPPKTLHDVVVAAYRGKVSA